jgi:alkylated DNA repair dioxygenase AlkB
MKKHNQYHDGRKDVNKIGSGDSYYIAKFLKSEKTELFKALLDEVEFEQMFNISLKNEKVYPLPRLVAAQTFYEDAEGTPIYRMPGCNESNIETKPWTKTVKYIRDKASSLLGQEFNHCVIGLFRNERDSLAYHKDKLLDLEPDSVIISVSFGLGRLRECNEQVGRPIVFKSEKDGSEQTILLQPGSLLVFGQETNHKYKHAINKVKESMGARISLSFRTISTKILDGSIVGQGEEYQETNYPFIKSFDDETQYTEKMKKQIISYKDEAIEEIKKIKAATM